MRPARGPRTGHNAHRRTSCRRTSLATTRWSIAPSIVGDLHYGIAATARITKTQPPTGSTSGNQAAPTAMCPTGHHGSRPTQASTWRSLLHDRCPPKYSEQRSAGGAAHSGVALQPEPQSNSRPPDGTGTTPRSRLPGAGVGDPGREEPNGPGHRPNAQRPSTRCLLRRCRPEPATLCTSWCIRSIMHHRCLPSRWWGECWPDRGV